MITKEEMTYNREYVSTDVVNKSGTVFLGKAYADQWLVAYVRYSEGFALPVNDYVPHAIGYSNERGYLYVGRKHTGKIVDIYTSTVDEKSGRVK